MRHPKPSYKLEDHGILDRLLPHEKSIICMRLGIIDYDRCHSLKEIGVIINKSIEGTRRIEFKILCKMRHPYVFKSYSRFSNKAKVHFGLWRN